MPQRNPQNQQARDLNNRASRRQQQRAEAKQHDAWQQQRQGSTYDVEDGDDHRLVRGDPYGNGRRDDYDGDRIGSGGYGRGDYGDRDHRDGGFGGGRGNDRYDHLGHRGGYEGASASDREQWDEQGDGWRGNDRGGPARGRDERWGSRSASRHDTDRYLGDTSWDSADGGSSDSAMRQRNDGYGGRPRNAGGRRGSADDGYGEGREQRDRDDRASARTGRWDTRGPHAGRGPKGYRRADERIEEEINEALTRHEDIDASEIEVSVHDGEVTLSGTVSDRDAKRAAEDVAEACSGVKDVQNQLRVAASTTSAGARDDADDEDDTDDEDELVETRRATAASARGKGKQAKRAKGGSGRRTGTR